MGGGGSLFVLALDQSSDDNIFSTASSPAHFTLLLQVYHKIDNPHFEIAGSDTVQLPLPKKRPAFPSWVRHDELFFWADPDYYAHLFQWWGEILQEIAGFGLRCLSKVGSVLPRTSGPTRRFVERAELALGIRHVKRYKTESIPWKRVPGRIIDFDAHDVGGWISRGAFICLHDEHENRGWCSSYLHDLLEGVGGCSLVLCTDE